MPPLALGPPRTSMPPFEPGRFTGPLLLEDLPRMLSEPVEEPRPSVMPIAVGTHAHPQASAHPQARASSVPPTPVPSSPRRRWAILFVALGLLTSIVIAALGLLALGVAGWQFTAVRNEDVAVRRALTIETVPSGATIFVGPTRIRSAPCVVAGDELGGQPIIAIAPGFEPQILRAERIDDLTRNSDRVQLTLQPQVAPSIAIYVEFDGQGVIYSHEGSGVLGTAPGVIRLAANSPRLLTLVDDANGQHMTFDASTCVPGTLCVRRVGPP